MVATAKVVRVHEVCNESISCKSAFCPFLHIIFYLQSNNQISIQYSQSNIWIIKIYSSNQSGYLGVLFVCLFSFVLVFVVAFLTLLTEKSLV